MAENKINTTYLDQEGVSRLVANIDRVYATKKSVKNIDEGLKDLIDAEETRASDREDAIESYAQGIDSALTTEVSTARANELRIEAESQTRDTEISETLDEEIQASRVKEGELETEDARLQRVINSLDSRLQGEIDDLDSSRLVGIKVNGSLVDVENLVANIRLSDFNPNISILVMKKSEFPLVGDNSKLYVDEDTSVIWQWDANNEEYIEAGKFNVLLVDELPEVGDPEVLYILSDNHSINIYVGGDDPNTRWQEISGQDKELREEFEEFKTDHPDFHVEWANIDNKPGTYAPATHNHDDLYYTQAQVDERIHESGISPEEFDAHKSSATPHPAFETRIDEKISVKANTSMVMQHINNVSNPHAVDKIQIGLGNVDNTSDLDKPISTAVQSALTLKADMSWVADSIEGKLDVEDVIDNLITSQSEKPLSAKQGVVLDEKILDLDTKVQSLGAALVFKGTVSSKTDLYDIVSKSQGDAYQINSNGEDEEDGAMYAWDGYNWVQIVAAATDLTSLIATDAEVHSIIDDYS